MGLNSPQRYTNLRQFGEAYPYYRYSYINNFRSAPSLEATHGMGKDVEAWSGAPGRSATPRPNHGPIPLSGPLRRGDSGGAHADGTSGHPAGR